MKEFSFTSFLTSNLNVEANDISALTEDCNRRVYKKDELLFQPGMVCSHTFFVEKGLIRQYSIDPAGKEHILQFAPENWFVSDRESVYFNQPSQYFIQALEETQVVLIDEEFIRVLEKKIPAFRDFNNRLLHNQIRHLQNRVNLLLSALAEDRYLTFVKMYPDVLLRVPQKMVASYLGITPEGLSRVRKELARKNKQ
ncbi:MAG: cyclic nucleotide-binding domain-containing protein [Bacteroidetes bacterium]|jgi:CRP-like cAMP-binding protein|nr:cyclic nucleotide-binding domain-containing protein [Bacteroidota bacterium]